MKRFQYIISLLALIATSCVGQPDDSSDLTLSISVSQPNICVDNSESVTLRVKCQSVDVTEQAEIYYTHQGEEVAVEGGEFTATAAGEYHFSARYDGLETTSYAVVEAYTTDQLTGEFFRRNLVMKFTGTWCVNCPYMGSMITEVEHSMPNRLVEMAVHWQDVLTVDEGNQLVSDYNIYSLPTALIDLYNSTTTASASIIEGLIESSTAANIADVGVRVSSKVNGSMVEVEVGAMANDAGSYKVAVALVVDNYQYTQTGADSSYKQDKVLRYYLSALNGDSVDLSSAGSEATLNYSSELPTEALTSESRIIAYVISEQGDKAAVVNATECVIGEAIDYIYEVE